MDLSAKMFPKPNYEQLSKETDYSCQGSCTCKYLNNRTEYDRMQIMATQNNKQFSFPKYSNIKTSGHNWLDY